MTGTRSIARTAGLLAACALPACQRAPAARPDAGAGRSPVEQREEQLRLAVISADTAQLGALWAPEYLSTSAVGHTSTRAEALMAFASGLVKVDSAVVRELD